MNWRHRLTGLLRRNKRAGIEDPFVRRLRSLVIGEGMLVEGNIALLELAVKRMPPDGSVIEIGSYGGLSTNLIVHLLRRNSRPHPVFSCDAWVYEGFEDARRGPSAGIDGRSDISRTAYSAYMKQAFVNATRLLSADRLPHAFHLRSDEFLRLWNEGAARSDLFGRDVTLGGPVSFAYIDGDHSEEAAAADFAGIARHLLPGGFVLLDDSADGLPFGSVRVARRILSNPAFELVARRPNYLFRRVSSSR